MTTPAVQLKLAAGMIGPMVQPALAGLARATAAGGMPAMAESIAAAIGPYCQAPDDRANVVRLLRALAEAMERKA